ncbi:MAG: hypothetical protein HZC41_05850 [Chloroflexi bacterium]|nr:hypothetical protein [Chloroflexota bacterium]
MSKADQKFTMLEPVEIERDRFAFHFSTSEADLIDFVSTLACVRNVTILDEGRAALVEIDNEFDPDEAWHWVRTELEDELAVQLDDIWYEAVKWIL